jgi:multicomponent Na+:H+ antiporter subunit F
VIYAMAEVAILIAITLGLIRAIRGPTLFDRVLAVNMVGGQTVLMVAVLGFQVDRPVFLDVALVYVLIAFMGTIAVLRFTEPVARERRIDDGGKNR